MKHQSAITRTLAVIGVLSVTFLGYDWYSRREYQAQLDQARQAAEQERQRAEHYKTQLGSVLSERKTTRFRVLRTEQLGNAPPRYLLRVGQWNDKSEKVFTRDLEISGNKIYFEGVVVHFQPEQIANGKHNLHLLMRVFSDVVPPAEGVSLLDEQLAAADEIARESVPQLDEHSRREVQLYLRKIAEEPDFARTEGVRTVNGQAVYDHEELAEGYVYTIVEKADGGYLIEKAQIP